MKKQKTKRKNRHILKGTHTHTHTHTPFNGLLVWVGRYQQKHSPTHTHPDHWTSFINFLHLLGSIASSLFSLRARQSSLTTSLQVLFGLPLGLGPSTSYSMHFFTQSSSAFRSTCPYHSSLFCCNTNAMSSIPSLSLSAPYLEICLILKETKHKITQTKPKQLLSYGHCTVQHALAGTSS